MKSNIVLLSSGSLQYFLINVSSADLYGLCLFLLGSSRILPRTEKVFSVPTVVAGNDKYILTSFHKVGHIPRSRDLGLLITPKKQDRKIITVLIAYLLFAGG